VKQPGAASIAHTVQALAEFLHCCARRFDLSMCCLLEQLKPWFKKLDGYLNLHQADAVAILL
jgi:hypothetical protein